MSREYWSQFTQQEINDMHGIEDLPYDPDECFEEDDSETIIREERECVCDWGDFF